MENPKLVNQIQDFMTEYNKVSQEFHNLIDKYEKEGLPEDKQLKVESRKKLKDMSVQLIYICESMIACSPNFLNTLKTAICISNALHFYQKENLNKE